MVRQLLHLKTETEIEPLIRKQNVLGQMGEGMGVEGVPLLRFSRNMYLTKVSKPLSSHRKEKEMDKRHSQYT